MLLALIIALTPAASALSGRQAGPSIDLAAGLGLGGAPVRAAVGGQGSVGVWTGTYDDAYAFGKFWYVGATGRVDWRPDTLSIAPMLEVRRGLDIFVAGIHWFAAGGVIQPLPAEGPAVPLGWTGRAGLGAKFRRHKFWGLTLRLEAGVDGIAGTPSFAGGALVGVGFARPGKMVETTF